MESMLIDQDYFAGVNIPDIFGLDQIQGTGLRSQDKTAIELPQAKGPETMGVPRSDQRIFRKKADGISSPDLRKGLDGLLQITLFFRSGDQVDKDLAVHGGLKDRPLGFQLIF